MSQLYQDSMAISREFGPATYFITVTSNPQWPEIQSALLLGQAANGHPDLVVRVFKQHLHTVDGVQHATCKDACVALGLLEDDGEWHQCLTEACQVQVGVSVRRVFAVIF